jgi:hypothetical protein
VQDATLGKMLQGGLNKSASRMFSQSTLAQMINNTIENVTKGKGQW